MTDMYASAMAKIDQIQSQCSEDNWDTNNAFPVPIEVCDRARMLMIEYKSPPTKVRAGAMGSVYFAWEDGSTLEIFEHQLITRFPNGDMLFMGENEDGKPTHHWCYAEEPNK